MSGVQLSNAIKAGHISCVEVMNAYLDQIDRFNSRINAIVSLQGRDGLLKQAALCDEQLSRGEYLGWMHGFPHAIKDLAPVKGIPRTMGSPFLRDFRSDGRRNLCRTHQESRRYRHWQDQHAGIWPWIANFQSGVWGPQRLWPVQDGRGPQRRGRSGARAADAPRGGWKQPCRFPAKSRSLQQCPRLSDVLRPSADERHKCLRCGARRRWADGADRVGSRCSLPCRPVMTLARRSQLEKTEAASE